jgi:hypothetical protein
MITALGSECIARGVLGLALDLASDTDSVAFASIQIVFNLHMFRVRHQTDADSQGISKPRLHTYVRQLSLALQNIGGLGPFVKEDHLLTAAERGGADGDLSGQEFAFSPTTCWFRTSLSIAKTPNTPNPAVSSCVSFSALAGSINFGSGGLPSDPPPTHMG